MGLNGQGSLLTQIMTPDPKIFSTTLAGKTWPKDTATATIMFKTMNGQVPQYISQLFTKTSDIHAYSLRRSGDSLFIPRPNTEALKKSFSYRGAILWNSLSSDQCNATSIAQFINYL